MPVEHGARSRRSYRWARVLTAVLVVVVLLILTGHLLLWWRFNTDQVRRRLEAAVAGATDSLYLVRIGTAEFSLLDRSFRISGFELYPDSGAFARRGQTSPAPHTRYHVTAASLHAGGVGLRRFLRSQLSARSIEVDSLRVEIEVDRTKPRGPPTPATLPHQALQTSRPLRIDQLHVEHSTVLFSERAIDGSRFGTLPFTNLEAWFTNLTNESGKSASPCEIEVQARFAGASRMEAHFTYDLSAKELNLSYSVSFGRMDAMALNRFLIDLEGVRVRQGELDSARFAAVIHDDVARGELLLLYHNLEIETLDKVTRHCDLKDALRTLFFNSFKLEGANPRHEEDDGPVVAAVQERRRPETPLFKFIWLTLRQGVFKTLGV